MSRYIHDKTNNTLIPVSGLPQIDNELDSNSVNPVQNKAIVEGISPMLNVLGAKNLLPNDATTQTIYGVTFTVNSDGSVRANGTATSTIIFIYSNKTFIGENGKKYILNGCPSQSGQGYRIDAWGDNTPIFFDYGNGVEFTSNGDALYVRIIITEGVTISNITFKPMIRPASVSDDTYVPYAMTNRELTTHTVKTKEVTGTTGSTGNLPLGFMDDIAIVSLKENSTKLAIPLWGGSSGWYAKVFNQADMTMAANTSVSLKVYYIEL